MTQNESVGCECEALFVIGQPESSRNRYIYIYIERERERERVRMYQLIQKDMNPDRRITLAADLVLLLQTRPIWLLFWVREFHLVPSSSPGPRLFELKLSTFAGGDPKVPFSTATAPRCSGGFYSFSLIAPLYS